MTLETTRIMVDVSRLHMAQARHFALSYSNQDEGGLRLVTAGETEALMWNLDVDTWGDIACRSAGSNLAAEEWALWGPSDTERFAICPHYPLPD